ncbi:MAG: surface lipoprotein assembly modifier [Panacagrimonas sp.]
MRKSRGFRTAAVSALLASALGVFGLDPARADATAAQSRFQDGVAAYRAGDPAAALRHFEQAQAQGLDNAELRFNLGLAWYKLGEYDRAGNAFEHLRDDPTFVVLADYHLGLVAAQHGKPEAAKAYLRKVLAATESPGLHRLAQTALDRIDVRPADGGLTTSGSLGGGFDSNRNQHSDAVQVADADPEAAFVELSGGLRYSSPATGAHELRANLYLRDHVSDHLLDQHTVQASLRHPFRQAGWSASLGLDSEAAWLGGRALQQAAGISLEVQRSLGSSSLSLRLRPDWVVAGDAYPYLDGSRQRADLSYVFAITGARVRASYDWEANDRRDLESGGQFFDQSPLRQGIGVRVSHARAGLSLEWSARWRHSRYRRDNRFLRDAVLVERRRIEDLAQIGALAKLRLDPAWSLKLDYRYSDNRSSLDLYDYDRHAILLGLEWMH